MKVFTNKGLGFDNLNMRFMHGASMLLYPKFGLVVWD